MAELGPARLDTASLVSKDFTALGWAHLGWTRMDCAGLGWNGRNCNRLGWALVSDKRNSAGLSLAGLGPVRVECAWLGTARLAWV